MDLAEQSDLAEAAAIAQSMSPEEIARGLSSRNKRTARLSALALQKCGPMATQPLLKAYFRSNSAEQARTKEQNISEAVRAILAAIVAILALSRVIPEPLGDWVAPLVGGLLFHFIFGRYILSHDSLPALRALCLLDDKRVLEALIDSLTRPSARKPDVRGAIAKLLPTVTSGDRDLIRPIGLRILVEELPRGGAKFCLGVLHAIEVLGDGSFVDTVGLLARPIEPARGTMTMTTWLSQCLATLAVDPAVREAAERCLAVEEARHAERMKMDTLLRPSEPAGESSLLRPVTSRPTEDHAILGRPSDDPNP